MGAAEVVFKDPDITAAYLAFLDVVIQRSGPMTVIVVPWDAAEPLAVSPVVRGHSDAAGVLLALGLALESRVREARPGLRAEITSGGGGPTFIDREVQAAHVRLLDAICSWERGTGAEFTTIVVPWHPPEPIMIATSGKPQAERAIHDVLQALGHALVRRKRRSGS